MSAERRVQIVECANCECQFDSTLPECPECADITEPLVCAAWKARAEAAEAKLAKRACPQDVMQAFARLDARRNDLRSAPEFTAMKADFDVLATWLDVIAAAEATP